jgi:hypothetical protein
MAEREQEELLVLLHLAAAALPGTEIKAQILVLCHFLSS